MLQDLRRRIRRGGPGAPVRIVDVPGSCRLLPADPPQVAPVRLTRLLEAARSEEWEMAIGPAEQRLFGRLCPRCGSDLLCRSETGLPASGPHPERFR
jgi:hypothetical protein